MTWLDDVKNRMHALGFPWTVRREDEEGGTIRYDLCDPSGADVVSVDDFRHDTARKIAEDMAAVTTDLARAVREIEVLRQALDAIVQLPPNEAGSLAARTLAHHRRRMEEP